MQLHPPPRTIKFAHGYLQKPILWNIFAPTNGGGPGTCTHIWRFILRFHLLFMLSLYIIHYFIMFEILLYYDLMQLWGKARAPACLRRGMKCCRERQVYLHLVSRDYHPTGHPPRPVLFFIAIVLLRPWFFLGSAFKLVYPYNCFKNARTPLKKEPTIFNSMRM